MLENTKSTSHNIDTLRPFIPKGSHPVETGNYLIPTNEISRMYEHVLSWIENRSPGAIIYGRPRLGKSRATSYLVKRLPLDIGENTPIYHILCRRYKNPNENFFFEDLLKSVGHSIITTGKLNQKRDRLMKFLLEQTSISNSKKIIFFIDDAQRLIEIQYDWLMDLHNELDSYGITLTTILVGQKELIHQKSAFINGGKHQIIGRFMCHQYRFKGIESLNDLQICLNCYDSDSYYPSDSECTFTEYFLTDAYIQGYRLLHSAEDIYQIFIDLRRTNKLPAKFEIPMLYMTLTIEYILKKFGSNGLNLGIITQSHWEEAIRNSGYIESELIYGI